jgi:hypothetical protein
MDVVIAYFKVEPHHSLKQTKENHRNFSQVSWSLGWELSPGPEAKVLTIWQWYSVNFLLDLNPADNSLLPSINKWDCYGHQPSQIPNGKTDWYLWSGCLQSLFSQMVDCHEIVYNDNGTTGHWYWHFPMILKMVAMETFLCNGQLMLDPIICKIYIYCKKYQCDDKTKSRFKLIFCFTTSGLVISYRQVLYEIHVKVY